MRIPVFWCYIRDTYIYSVYIGNTHLTNDIVAIYLNKLSRNVCNFIAVQNNSETWFPHAQLDWANDLSLWTKWIRIRYMFLLITLIATTHFEMILFPMNQKMGCRNSKVSGFPFSWEWGAFKNPILDKCDVIL